jgi:ABC-type transport system involved in multi-copper enzyme maturation permease subunit/uncharacterized membrane protein SpoIIM required for sporulation
VLISDARRQEIGETLTMVGALVRREIRDTLRDWRIVVPIIILTLFFPVLMSFFADLALDYVARYGGAPIIGERLLPFMLMVVGFFPISFSLVIALETFVGEKERGSLEPLLATPLTDTELYLSKMLAAMIPPLLAAYLGISVYLIGLHFFKGWTPEPALLALVVVLTTVEGLVMVSAAVVLSSQTTSVRAANLLASFIIIPMALLVQGEALIMFWARYGVLWWVVLFLVVVNVVLVRLGIQTFNREGLLGREIDELNIPFLWRTFRAHLRCGRWFFGIEQERLPRPLRWLAVVGGVYCRDIPEILKQSKLALMVVMAGLVLAVAVGYVFAYQYPLPSGLLNLQDVSIDAFDELSAVSWLPSFTAWGVLGNNVQSLAAASLLAIFSLGTLAVALLMVPFAMIFYFVAQVARIGYSPLLFLAAFVLPHGVLEIPAAVIATGLAVRLGASVVAPPANASVSSAWLWALADLLKVFVALVLPLLALAAVVEVHVTPAVVVWAFG